MSGIEVPINRQEWYTACNNHHLADVRISGFGANALGSTSRLDYQDWLLLKIVWPPQRYRLTHVEFFGEKASSRSTDALAALSKEDWWKLLTEGEGEGNEKPWNWKQLAAWKQSANDIIMRKPFDPDPAGVMFDPTDPFRFDVRGNMLPVTPIKSSARPKEPSPAPRQSAHAAANIGEGTGGFLRMREYQPFDIADPAHMQELSLLVYSLTKYLVEHEDRGRFRPKP